MHRAHLAWIVLLAAAASPGCAPEEDQPVVLDPTDTTARDARDASPSDLPVSCADRPDDGDRCTTQHMQCTQHTDCCSCGCATLRSCTCDQQGVWRCTDIDRGVCSVCKEDVVDAPHDDVAVECSDRLQGRLCSTPGASCSVEPTWCCECGCEGGLDCTCLDSGRWSCSDVISDICYFCNWEEDIVEPPDATEVTDASADAATDVAEPARCTADTDCGPDAHCVPPASPTLRCPRAADCPAGSICDTTSHHCVELGCRDDRSCDGGWCIDGLCRAQPGRCAVAP